MTYTTQSSLDSNFKSGESDFIRKAMKQPLLTKEDEQQLTRAWKHRPGFKGVGSTDTFILSLGRELCAQI